MLEPDLITICPGMNDLLTVCTDLDAIMARYAEGLKTLQQTGALVMVFTAADLRTVPLFRRLRGRAAIYNELLRDIAEDLGVQLVDFWRFTEYRDPRMWDRDRIHLSSLGTNTWQREFLTPLPSRISWPPHRPTYRNHRDRSSTCAPTCAGRRRSRRPGLSAGCGG